MAKLDKLDIMYERKKFFKIVFPTLEPGEYIRVFQNNKTELEQDREKTIYSNVEFFNNIDDMNEYIEKKKFNKNTYFNLSTTDGKSGEFESLKTRSVLAFDFDKKDNEGLTVQDIVNRFKDIKLWYHVIVDSGHGFHTYTCIESTTDLQKVDELQCILGTKLKADMGAVKTTQILRCPFSFNIKYKPTKQVNIIFQYDKSTIKRYSINNLYNRFCTAAKTSKADNIGNKATEYTLKNHSKIKPCIANILAKGSFEGNRNADLQKIVVTLRRLNKSLSEVQYICKEWNSKNKPQLAEHELTYQVKNLYDNMLQVSYECKGCKHTNECFSVIESDFEYIEGEDIVTIEYKVAKKLKYSRRSKMGGNELLIFNVLKHFDKELSIDDIIKHLTYDNKCRLSLKTIRDTLNKLLEDDLIIQHKGIKKQGIKDTYTINQIRAKADTIFKMSYFPTLICIYRIITPGELRLYTHMRYKHDLAVKDGKAKGNIFRINQVELAEDLKTDQAKVSRMIQGLIKAKILEIWETKINDKGFEYHTYRLVK
jgi:predicted transcriptional regulator